MDSSGRRLAISALLACLALGPAWPASAVPIATESFDYAPGELDGASGGSGFTGAWSADIGATEVMDPGLPLVFSSGGVTIDGGSRALSVTGNDDAAIFRSLAAPVSLDSLFVSFLFRYQGSVDDNDFLTLWHDDSPGGTHTTRPNIGVKGNRGNGSGPEDVVARLQLSGSGQAYAVDLVESQTYLILGRLYKSVPGVGNDYDRFEIWVNPSAGAEGTPDLVASGSGAIDSFGVIGLRSVNLDPGDTFWVDEITYATDFATAVPEPDTAFLMGLGLAGLAMAGTRSGWISRRASPTRGGAPHGRAWRIARSSRSWARSRS